MLVHDSAICSVPYISYMDLKGQRYSLCNIVRLIARDNIAYISSLDLVRYSIAWNLMQYPLFTPKVDECVAVRGIIRGSRETV